MAKKNKQKVEGVEEQRPASTKEEIEAAVMAAMGGNANAQDVHQAFAQTIHEKPDEIPNPVPVQKKPVAKAEVKHDVEVGEFDAEFTATSAHNLADANPDKFILPYLNDINDKIRFEAKQGGYSTSVKFRVSQNDWVNVNHIMDWYTVHGFNVVDHTMSSSPYETTGFIMHEFTISWANPVTK